MKTDQCRMCPWMCGHGHSLWRPRDRTRWMDLTPQSEFPPWDQVLLRSMLLPGKSNLSQKYKPFGGKSSPVLMSCQLSSMSCQLSLSSPLPLLTLEIWKREVMRLGKEATSDATSAWLVHVLEKPCMIRKCFATTGASDVGHIKQVRSWTPKKNTYRSLGNFRGAISRNMLTFADSARQGSLATSLTWMLTRYDKCILRCIPQTLIFVC